MAAFGGSGLLLLSWVAWIAGTVVFHISMPWQSRMPGLLTDMITYGKLRPSSPPSESSSFSSTLSCLLTPFSGVPRRYFTHFYAWGCVWNFLLLATFLSCFHGFQPPGVGVLMKILTGAPLQGPCGGQWSQEQLDVVIVLSLCLMQTVRRLVECFVATVFSDSKMHFLHYVLGLYFYTAVGPTALLHLNGRSSGVPAPSTASPLSLLHWYHVAALLLFAWASYHQFCCHKILANLRERQQHVFSKPQNPLPPLQPHTHDYGLPCGDWFSYVSSPHYFAEILIYSALLVVQCGTSVRCALWLPWVFVVSALTLSARQTHMWYCSKFEDYPKHRRIIFPFFY